MLRGMGKILSSSVDGNTLNLTVSCQRLDAVTARDFKAEVEALWQPQVQKLVVDVGTVEFVDSSGIGALLSIYKKLPPESASIKLLQVHPTVQAVIELLRLHRIFEIQPR